MIDLIERCHGELEPKINCLDKGHVILIDVMPRISPDGGPTTCDSAVLEAARISYISNKKKETTRGEDRGLIRYLMRHRHSTPFEMIEWKFCIKMPIMVARQFLRHRTANVNELSGRYSPLPNEFYLPSIVRKQSMTNKQGSEGSVDPKTAKEFLNHLEQTYAQTYAAYEKAVAGGVGKEIARIGLSVGIYTEFFWKIDLHNLLHFLSLRCDKHAQEEMRVFANAILRLITPLVPDVIEAWEDFHPSRSAMLLTALEVEALRSWLSNIPNPELLLGGMATNRERDEWAEKKKRLWEEK